MVAKGQRVSLMPLSRGEHASVRFSLGEENTEPDIARIADEVPAVIARLRALAGPRMEQSA